MLLRRSGSRFGAWLLPLFYCFDAQACIPLERVDIEESRPLAGQRAVALVEDLRGACIDGDLLQQLLSRISGFYIDQGYVTTRPYLLEQDVSDGQVDIRVVVGFVEAVIDADSGAPDTRYATAFYGRGEILNLRDLENALEVIERPASVRADFEVRPGATQGGSVIAIGTTIGDPSTIELGVNAQTDLDAQLSLFASLDNPLDINDIVSFRANSGELQRSFQSNRSRELSYSFPLGSYLFELSRSDVEFEQRVQGINESFLSTGDSVADRLRVSRPLWRDQSNRWSLSLALEVKDARNFFAGQLIDVSSYRTTQLQLELSHLHLAPWGQVATRYRLHQGLDSYGARDDDYFTLQDGSENEARLQFEKFIIDSRLLIPLGNSDWQAGASVLLHYSDDLLFAADQLSLGSPYTVRGYSSALSGSNAWYLRLELTRQLRSQALPFGRNPLVKAISVSFGLDYGEVKCEADNPDVCGEIYGAGIGLSLSDANFSGSLVWGHPLKEREDGVGDEDQFLVDLRWRL